jgi:hypothetical protein
MQNKIDFKLGFLKRKVVKKVEVRQSERQTETKTERNKRLKEKS